MGEVKKNKLAGVGGWLTFWIVIFSLSGLVYIYTFFLALESDMSNPSTMTLLITSPLLAVGYLLSTVLLALRKKIAKTATYITLAVSTLSAIILTIVQSVESIAGTAALIMTSLVVHGLIGLYFAVSQRIKLTLTED